MWKSLFVTRGDVLVFMDADLLDWDTHFVPGLLGPLLTRPEVALVKGFYERPLVSADGTADDTAAYEGGRVTELVARPLLNLLFPELAGLVQPLAGEWAVRRSLFASLSVPTGYAVETTALIDTARTLGVDAIAQVDLGRRAHRHQALRDLGAMATQILTAVWTRAQDVGLPDGPLALRQYHPVDGVIAPLTQSVDLTERAPASAYLGDRP
jgi:glucosyl-3-phosphoglycerate synthase